MWRETTKHPRNLDTFRREFDDFLPKTVLDFHVHLMPSGLIPPGEPYLCAGHPIMKYDLDDLAQDLAELYPDRQTLAVCFGFPDIRYDRARNNAYLADACDGRRFFPLYLLDPLEDTPETLDAALGAGGFLGVKPYLDYARKPNPNDTEIPEMIPDWAMEVVDRHRGIVMLHIPRPRRLADPLNQKQIGRLCATCPDASVVLAHVGRAYYLENIVGHLDALCGIPNLYFDLAMLNHWEVLEYLFQRARHDRLLYATDTPIALAPGKSVEINNQYTYVTPVPWKLSISDDHGKLVFTAFAYEELRAIRKATERLGLGKDFLEGLFSGNGLRLIESAVARPVTTAGVRR